MVWVCEGAWVCVHRPRARETTAAIERTHLLGNAATEVKDSVVGNT